MVQAKKDEGMNGKSDKRLTLNIVLGIIFLLFISVNVVSYFQIQNLLLANQWVVHSQKVIYLINDLWATVLEIQTSQRDYVIKNEALFITSYHEYVAKLFKRYHELDNILIKGTPRIQRLHDLLPLLKRKVALSNQVIQTFQAKGREEAEKLIIEHKGIVLLSEIREITSGIKEEEALLLRDRELDVYKITKLTNYYLITTNALTLALLILLFALINWQYSKRQQAQKQLKEMIRGTDNAIALSSILQSCSALEETFEPLATYCQKILPFPGILYLAHSKHNYMEFAVKWGRPVSREEEVLSPNHCWALHRGKIHSFDNAVNSIICEHAKQAHRKIPSYLCIPLQAQNDNVGLLYVELSKNEQLSEGKFRQLMVNFESLIMTTADVIASSLANIKLRETLKIRSIRDVLTGLYNRSYLEESFDREILRSQRQKSKLAVVMMDIDHFKAINDNYGHEAGDIVLVELGKLLRNRIRKSDIACRYGGEEILLLFFDIDNAEDAFNRVETIREEISQLAINHHGKIIAPLTASFGIAIMPQHGDNQVQLIAAADSALYKSKEAGRNRVTMAN